MMSNIFANTHHGAWKPGSSMTPTDIKRGLSPDRSFNQHFLFAVIEYVRPQFCITKRDVELGEVEISSSTDTGARSAALTGARERKHTLRWQASLEFSRCMFETICGANEHTKIFIYLFLPSLSKH